MRYKKKYLLLLLAFGWSIWYLDLFVTEQNVDRRDCPCTHPTRDSKSPDIYRSMPLSGSNTKSTIAAIRNISHSTATAARYSIKQLLSTPKWLKKYLPHITDPQYVYPRIHWTQGRSNVSIVIGIPTIKRPSNDSYILHTIQSFFDSMRDEERKDIIVVISITEPWNIDFETALLEKIRSRFPRQLDEGSLEVIAPHPQFYPDLNKLKLSLGDPKSRVKWRSKQNMDYGFIMMHCMSKGAFYLQMEDDISTVPGFVTSMKKTIEKERHKPWIFLAFSSLGYIGRLFHAADVYGIMQFLLERFDKKPCDWLQYDYLATLVCAPGLERKKCHKEIGKFTWLIQPTLFQHKGFRSSYQGSVNKLQDKFFPRGNKAGVYANPKVNSLKTSLQAHNKHTLDVVYNSKGFFWGKNPVKGDTIDFIYHPPVSISRIDIVSGNKDRPTDIISGATLEILPASKPTWDCSLLKRNLTSYALDKQIATDLSRLNTSDNADRYFVLTTFSTGSVKAMVLSDVGKIRMIRIRFGIDLRHWIILDQILIYSN